MKVNDKMNDKKALEIINKIFNNVFNQENLFTLEELFKKFAFDIKLPKQVLDSTTNEPTWSNSANSPKFITNTNMIKKDTTKGWMLPKKEINNIDQIIEIWNNINLTTTERVYDSINVAKSDTIYSCENVYRSNDSRACKNIVYCNSCGNSEYMLASQRSGNCIFCIRTNDSQNCSNSYNVICSNKIINSLFIQDCSDLYECMFCAHISSKKYCIANMQFTENEYYTIKKAIINWLLNS